MNKNVDLDINNYDSNDLLNFFNLNENYSLDNLEEKVKTMVDGIISFDNKSYDSKYKFEIINFIKTAKDFLTSFKYDIENNKAIKKDLSKFINQGRDPNVGRIITPLNSHQVLQTQIIPPNNIDGYNYDTVTSVYVFNTLARNDFYITYASFSTFDLPVKWKNVISLSLSSTNIPNVMYTFNNDSGTNQIYIKEDITDLSGIVTLPQGNYVPYTFSFANPLSPITAVSFPDALTKEINLQLKTYDLDPSGNPINFRFKVSIDLSNYHLTITNTTYTFTMDTIIKRPNDLCSPYSNLLVNDTSTTNPNNKSELNEITYVQTMGYIMGYRNIFYQGEKHYETESIFQNSYSDYIYFVLEDYTGSQPSSTTYGILGNGVLEGNILGVVPITTSSFTTTFDNNSNFIYKKREYFGPVDISRISVKLLNARGNLLDLQRTDFSFSIKVNSIYDLNKKSKFNLRGQGLF
jgi:hypothetical protein